MRLWKVIASDYFALGTTTDLKTLLVILLSAEMIARAIAVQAVDRPTPIAGRSTLGTTAGVPRLHMPLGPHGVRVLQSAMVDGFTRWSRNSSFDEI